jgi:hypothetical protein
MTPTANGLWRLQGELFEMLEAREEAQQNVQRAIVGPGGCSSNDSGELSPLQIAEAELEAIETGIQAYVRDKLVQVDDLRDPLMALSEGVALCKARAAAETNRAIMLQNRFDRLKDAIKQAMQFLEASGYWKPKQSKKLESAHGSFLLKGNGGAAPVEITDETLVPDEYCFVTVKIRADLMDRELELNEVDYGDAVKIGPREVSKSSVAAALALPCPACQATFGIEDVPCDACGGSGLQGVPGARLAPRGESVVVK